MTRYRSLSAPGHRRRYKPTMFGRHRRLKRRFEEVLGLVVAVSLGLIGLTQWVSDITPAEAQSIETVAVIILVAAVAVIAWRWSRRRSRRLAYEQTPREFRWDPCMPPTEFEARCADYLKLNGWHATTTPASGDQGADILAHKHRHSVVIQCKLYAKPVGNSAVQQVSAARSFYHAQSAFVVSNQGYTPATEALAKENTVHLLHFTALRQLDEILGVGKG